VRPPPESGEPEALIEEARQRARKRRLAYTVIAIAAVAGGAALFGLLKSGGGTKTTVVANGLSLGGRTLAPSANGKLALVDSTGSLLSSVNPDGSAPRLLARCRGFTACRIRAFAWSPDGERLLFFRADGEHMLSYSLYVVDADGRNTKELASCGFCGLLVGSRATWSPDGSSIAFTGENGLVVADVVRGGTRPLTRCDTPCADLFPAWSPDGSKLVFTRKGSLYTVKPDGSDLTKLTSDHLASNPTWSPDGRQLAFDGRDEIYVVDADGSRPALLLAASRGSGPSVPSWSPDGKRILFFTTPGSPGAYSAEVWVMNPDGTSRSRLYHSGCCVDDWSSPIWSPNGKSIAFSADSAGGVLVMKSDGSNLHTVSSNPSDVAWQPIR
jgi:Tol biopolymer transport system component